MGACFLMYELPRKKRDRLELGLLGLDLRLLTVADGNDVVGDAGAAIEHALLGGGGHVRSHDHVVEIEQRTAGLLNGLMLKDVQTGLEQGAVLQAGDQLDSL